jgi:hypothetical protein
MRTLLALIALLILAVVITQVVLSLTNIPQRIVVAQLQRTLGLRVEVSGVSTGWFGHTTLRDVTFALPLATQPLATAPVVRVRHTWLPVMLTTQSLNIRAIEIEGPTLRVAQLPSGDWNVQRAIAQIALGARPLNPEESRTRSRPTIPAVTISNGTLVVRDNKGRETTLAPVEFSGKQLGALVWQYSGKGGAKIDFEGEIAPGAPWQHRIDFTFRDLEPCVRPWLAHCPNTTQVTGHWVGRYLGDDGIAGRLTLGESQVGRLRPRGVAAIKLANGMLTVEPDHLLVETGRDALGNVRLVSGAVVIGERGIEAKTLEVELAGGAARLSGQWQPADDTATLDASWRDVRLPSTAAHNGQLHAELRSPLPGQPQVRLNLQSAGKLLADVGTWDTQLNLIGEGSSWNQLRLQLTGERFAWNGVRQLALNNLVASIVTNGRNATVESIRLEGSERLSGRGGYDFDRQSFWLWLRGDEMTLTPARDLPLSFMVNAWGDDQQVRLQQLFVQAPDLELSGDGYYVYRKPKPLELELYLRLVPGALERAVGGPLLTGNLHSAARVTGIASPLNLDLDGFFFADDLIVSNRTIGDVKMTMAGQVDGHDARFSFSKFKLFDANCQVSGVYPTDGRRAAMKIDGAAEGLSLAKLAEFLKLEGMSGELNGAWKLEVPPDDVRRATGSGTFAATAMTVGKQFQAQSARGTMKLADQRLDIEPIYLQQRDGSAEARARLSLAKPEVIELKVQANEWPIQLPRAGANAVVQGNLDVQLDARRKSATGSVAGSSKLALNGRSFGEAQLRADLRGRAAQVEKFAGTLLGGSVSGGGSIDLDKVESQSFALTWENLDGAQLALFWPQFEGLAGTYTGDLHIKAADPKTRPLEPLRMNVNSHVKDASWRGMQVGDGYWTAFLSRDRLVVENAHFDVAGGKLQLWARTSQHGRDPMNRNIGGNVLLDWESIDLKQLVHAFAPKAKPVIGRISGSLQFVGEPAHYDRAVGTGRAYIVDSDLANFGPVAFLYNAMHLDTNQPVPTGRGGADFRIEGSDLVIAQLRYFNRGTEIRASGAVRDFRAGPEAKLNIGAIGSARPLSQIKIPGFASVDKMFAALQANLTTVQIEGTLREPKTRIVSFSEISQALRAIVFGDYQEEKAAAEQSR